MDLLNEKHLQREPFPKFALLANSNHTVVLLTVPLEVHNHFDRSAIKEEMFRATKSQLMMTFQPVPSSVNVVSSLSDPARRSSQGILTNLETRV